MLTQAEVLARLAGLQAAQLRAWVAQAWVRPTAAGTEQMFDDDDLARLHLIFDLTDVMGVNDEAVPIILSLVDQVQVLRGCLTALDRAVMSHDDATAASIAARLRDLLGRAAP